MARNLKGGSFDVGLTAANAIIGPNFSRKTAVIETIRLAILGYIPEIGKLPKSTWELSSGPHMSVYIGFDNSCSVKRIFYLDGSTVKLDTSGTMQPPECGALMQADHYFGLTDHERVNYVFSHVRLPDSLTPEGIIAEVERLSFGEDHNERFEISKADCVEDVRKSFQPADERAGDPTKSSEKPSIQDALGTAIESFRMRFTEWNRRSKETQGAVMTMAELRLREPGIVSAAQDVDAKISEVSAKTETLIANKATLVERQSAVERSAERLAFIEGQLALPPYEKEKAVNDMRELNDANAKKKRKVLPAKKRAELQANLEEWISVDLSDASAITIQQRMIDEAMRQAKELSEMPSCPFCKSKGKNWQANIEVTLAKQIELATTVRDAAAKRKETAEREVARLQELLDKDDDAITANRMIEEGIKANRSEINSLEASMAENARARANFENELAGLMNLAPGDVDFEEQIRIIEAEQHELNLRRITLEAAKRNETQLKQDLKRAGEAQIEHSNAAAHVTAIKAVGELLKEKRKNLVVEAFQSLLVTANIVTAGVLKSPLTLHENTIGMWIDGKFVPHRVFSGTEKALTYIAIAVALSSQSQFKLVILDEVGRLDASNQCKMIGRLTDCVTRGIIDQYIIVGTTEPQQGGASKTLLPLNVIRL